MKTMFIKFSIFLLIVSMVGIMIVAGCKAEETKNVQSKETTEDSDMAEEPSEAEDVTSGISTGLYVPDPQPRPDVIKTKAPDGSEVAWFTDLFLTDEEVEKVRSMNATVCWEQQNSAEWTEVNLDAAKIVFAKLNIKLLAVANCENDPAVQRNNIENFQALNPDVIHVQPQALDISAEYFRPAIDAGIKFVFLSNVPEGLEWKKDFVGVATDDLYGMGEMLAHDLAEKMNYEGIVGFLNWASVNYVTDTRDGAFRTTMEENYPDIEIVPAPLGSIDEAAANASALITKYPDIKAFYTPWAGPASVILEPIRASGRTDILSVTHDLDDIIALDMAKGGATWEIAADLTYNLGWIRAMMTAYALLGKETPAMYTIVGQQPVRKENLLESYNICYRKDPAPEVMEALGY